MVPMADSNAWAALSDSILLVTRDGRTPKTPLVKSLEALDKSKLFAVVVNGVDGEEEKYYSGYYKEKTATAVKS
jgi:Mrp family chromosome partitioning ATPase